MSSLWPIVNNHVVEAQTFLTVVISVKAVMPKEHMGVPCCLFGTEGMDQLSVRLSKCDRLFQLHCLPIFFPRIHSFVNHHLFLIMGHEGCWIVSQWSSHKRLECTLDTSPAFTWHTHIQSLRLTKCAWTV